MICVKKGFPVYQVVSLIFVGILFIFALTLKFTSLLRPDAAQSSPESETEDEKKDLLVIDF
ncbi:hypothetical protein MHBO_002650 [Bonamia ostreae]|uniref:ATP synthase F0 subunit 8 n=1 Tax=Bonamia ostreae TaxID=126728 RepID=A0ABV2ANZ4_9EUKA